MSRSLPFRIGTRGSAMALAQAGLVRDRLAAAHPELAGPDAIAIVPISTVADRVLDRPLSAIGGKGLFVKELELALHERRIDCAVHSMKDVETILPAGMVLAAILPRDDPREAFLSRLAPTLASLPAGSRVGTSSLRRAAQILARRPDLRIVPLRGNANTRLAKLDGGECDATLLAIAGLRRIGLADRAQEILSTRDMLPAAAQGALGIECRADDGDAIATVATLACPDSTLRVEAERALLAALDGSCRTPVAALAELAGDTLEVSGFLYMPDGSAHWFERLSGPAGRGRDVGFETGRSLRSQAGTLYDAILK